MFAKVISTINVVSPVFVVFGCFTTCTVLFSGKFFKYGLKSKLSGILLSFLTSIFLPGSAVTFGIGVMVLPGMSFLAGFSGVAGMISTT